MWGWYSIHYVYFYVLNLDWFPRNQEQKKRPPEEPKNVFS